MVNPLTGVLAALAQSEVDGALDEPSQGLAPLIVKEVFRIIASMRDEGSPCSSSKQNVRVSLQIADRAYCSTTARWSMAGPRPSSPMTRSASAPWPARAPAGGRWAHEGSRLEA
jgi:hypothetical protein